MKKSLYDFRKLDFKGLLCLIKWARLEGWNPGLHDADAFWAADNDAFYGIFFQDNLIGGGSIVSYNGKLGFMGFFVVKPEYRSQGIGRRLWYLRRDTLLSRLRPDAPIGLDGVLAMQPFYRKGGFEIAFRDERYELKSSNYKVSNCISSIQTADFQLINHFDYKCFGFNREQFLKKWLFGLQRFTFKFMDKNLLKGYVVIRKASVGYRIGPLFAETPAIAEELLKATLTVILDEPIYIDVPVTNADALEMLKAHHAKYVFECARMYYGSIPTIPVQKIFGITTFELG